MTAKKERPRRGAEITPGMSERDVAAALGISTGELNRWKRLGAIPEDEFESRIARCVARDSEVTASAILREGAPVPARGRVQRALSLWRGMDAAARSAFLERVLAEDFEAGR